MCCSSVTSHACWEHQQLLTAKLCLVISFSTASVRSERYYREINVRLLTSIEELDAPEKFLADRNSPLLQRPVL